VLKYLIMVILCSSLRCNMPKTDAIRGESFHWNFDAYLRILKCLGNVFRIVSVMYVLKTVKYMQNGFYGDFPYLY